MQSPDDFFLFGFQDSNKLGVAQSLVTYNVLTKNIVLLDQMRKGLSMLGLLKNIEKYPHFFERFFTHQGSNVSPSFVKELLRVSVPDHDNLSAQKCSLFLYSFIESCSESELSNFLMFVTGTGFETTSLVPRSIKVSFTDTDAIYASTCLMEIKIPTMFESQTQFNSVFKAAINGHSFNTH